MTFLFETRLHNSLLFGLLLVGSLAGCNVEMKSSSSETPGGAKPVVPSDSKSQLAATDSGLEVTKPTIGSTKPLLKVETCYLAGQPAAEDFAAFKTAGIKKVVSLRDPSEINWDEKAAVEAAGLEFVQISLASPTELTDEKLDQICNLLHEAKQKEEAVLLHCGGAVRASAVWLAHYCVDQQATWGQADAFSANLVEVPEAWKTRVKSYVEQKAGGNAR